MIRSRFIILACLALGACATATVAIKAGFDFSRVKRVAVMGFSDYANRPGSGETVSGAFEQGLLMVGYDVIERSQVDKLLREKHLSSADPKAAQEIGRLLGADALLFGRITDFREPRERMTQVEVVDEHQDPIYVRRTKRSQVNGVSTSTQETVIDGYKTVRVVRREPRTVVMDGRLGVTARLVFVATGEVLWSGSDASRVYTFEDSSRALADSILKAVKTTWPTQAKK